MLPIVVFPLLHMLNLDMHSEPLGHELNLAAQTLDQHPSVPLDLIETIVMGIQPLLDPLKALIDPLKALINSFKALIDALESLIDPIEPYIERLKPPIEVLDKFLVHVASVTSEG